MVSVESKLASRRHRHMLERAAMDSEHAAAQQDLRNEMDQKRDRKDTKELRGRKIESDERFDRDSAYANKRAGAIQTLRGEQDLKSNAHDERYSADRERIQKAGSTAGAHPVKRGPEPHDPHGTIWHGLNSAMQQALIGVHEKYARLHDDADSEHFDLNRSRLQPEDVRAAKTVRSRYAKPGTKTASDISDGLENRHYRLLESEHAELKQKVSEFDKQIRDNHARVMRQAEERRAMAARHASE